MAWRVRRATLTDVPQCGDVCPTEKEDEREKERWSQGHLRVAPAPSAFSSFSSSLAKDHHSARDADKDVLCALRRKRSVSPQQPDCFAASV